MQVTRVGEGLWDGWLVDEDFFDKKIVDSRLKALIFLLSGGFSPGAKFLRWNPLIASRTLLKRGRSQAQLIEEFFSSEGLSLNSRGSQLAFT